MKEPFASLVTRLSRYRPAAWDELPDLGLYMDQVITYIERQLAPLRESAAEKPLTPAMVNNYVKMKLIPRPEGKKYSRDHLALLLMVCQLKRACPIDQIAQLFSLQLQSRSVQDLYVQFCDLEGSAFAQMEDSVPQEQVTRDSALDDALRMAVQAGTLCHVVQALLNAAQEEATGEIVAENEAKSDEKMKK